MRGPRPAPWSFWITLLVVCAPLQVIAADEVRLCFAKDVSSLTFVRDGRGQGLHGELIQIAIERLGLRSTWLAMPWSRCVLEAQNGRVDAIATASYNAERNAYLRYPDDAASNPQSNWAVAHSQDVVVTVAASHYEFDGDLRRLPAPVRAPRGWSVVAYLTAAGVSVDAGAPNDESNLAKLVRDGTGSVIAIDDSVRIALRRPEFAQALHVSARPLRSKSYFLPFSRRSKLRVEEIQAIWNAIAVLRSDEAVLKNLQEKY